MYILIFAFALAFKLYVSSLLPIFPDEAYYWIWSLHPQLSYFDHPPMVAYLYWLSGGIHDHWVRWPFLVLGQGTLWIWYLILKNLYYNSKDQKMWLYAALASPILGVGSILGTPDVPLVFFWSLSIWIFLRAIRNPTVLNYSLLGASLGMGFLSKYHIVLFVPSAFLYLLLNKQLRFVRWSNVVYTILFGVAFSSPVLWWNYQNHWSSFLFQLNHGFGGGDYEFYWTYSYILGLVVIIFPSLLWVIWKAKFSPIAAFAWLPLGFFLYSSFRSVVEANWVVMAFPALILMAVHGGLRWKQLRWQYGFWALVAFLIGTNIRKPWLPINIEKIREPFILRDLAAEIPNDLPIFTENYQQASSLWFWKRLPVYKVPESRRHDFFDSISPKPPKNQDFLLVLDTSSELPSWIAESSLQAKLEISGERYSVWRISLKL